MSLIILQCHLTQSTGRSSSFNSHTAMKETYLARTHRRTVCTQSAQVISAEHKYSELNKISQETDTQTAGSSFS